MRAASLLRGRLYRYNWMIAMAVMLVMAVVAIIALWPRSGPDGAVAPATIPAAQLESAQDRWVLVYVSGAVQRPGIYRLLVTQRVADAIVAAGGATANADPACMPNLAGHLKDGKQIAVPFSGRCSRTRTTRLDINTATRVELLTVAGMDAALADAIIGYREQTGGFQKLAELKSQLGVDTTLYKQLARGLQAP
jgi:competence protein ComEA